MLLQSEYLSRHGIALPEVQHTVGSGTLVLRVDKTCSQFNSRWLILQVVWKDPSNHPGTYEVKLLQPVHDSNSKREYFAAVKGYPPVIYINYEDFETFFLSFAKEEGIKAILDRKEICLATWEMFLFCNDSFLASNFTPAFQEIVATSLDFDLSVDERYLFYIEATNKMIREMYAVFERYDAAVHTLTKKTLPWLAKMINRDVA